MVNRFSVGAVAALLFTVFAVPVRAEQPLPARADIPNDPSVERGTLANGLKYAIMRNATPSGAVSIRLAFDVGSYEEEDEERGAAHFVEHMAFRSTRSFPNNDVDKLFEPLGIAFGPDHNAFTSLESTVYHMNLPTGDQERLAKAFGWLRDVADGVIFTDAAVDLERGVVLAEKDARNNPLVIAHDKVSQFQGGDLRSANRNPLGTPETLRALDAAKLRSFYRRWYRPENALLVIVGDMPAEELAKAAAAVFSSWKAQGAAASRPRDVSVPRPRPLQAFVHSEASVPTAISACHISAPDKRPVRNIEHFQRGVHRQLWSTILSSRLERMATKPDSGLIAAMVTVNNDVPDMKGVCLAAVPTLASWQKGLASAQAEFKRFAKDGPTDIEVEEALETLRSRLRGAIAQADSRSSGALADAIVAAEAAQFVFPSPREAMRAYNIVTDGVTPQDVKAAFARDWPNTDPLLAATTPAPIEEEELIAAWKSGASTQILESYADKKAVGWSYGDFGAIGKVAKREVLSPDYTRIRFENGTILNYKHTDFGAQAEVRVIFGGGRKSMDHDSYRTSQLAAGFLAEGGLGKMSYEDVEAVFANTTWQFAMGVGERAFVLAASPLSSQVEDEMKLLTAYMVDPGFRDTLDSKLPTVLDLVYKLTRAEPVSVAGQAIEKALFPSIGSMPAYERMAGFTSKEAERLLKPALTRSPVEISIVGDISEAEATEAVAESFGALPAREEKPGLEKGLASYQRFPETRPDPILAYHEGPAEKAAALLIWPLYVATPERRREEYALSLLADIFDAALRSRIRGEMGKTYSPAVDTTMPDHSDQGYLGARLETAPADLSEVIEAARATASELAAGDIDNDALEAARQPKLARMAQAKSTNEAWANAILEPQALKDLVEYEELVSSISLEEVKKAASEWLGSEPFVASAVPTRMKEQVQ